MKAWKWIILIGLLTLLLMGAAFLHPLVRFTANLYLDRADRASSVYINAIQGKERLDSKAKAQLQRYAENMLQGYLRCELTYDEAMAVLSPLAGSGLPQADIDRCIQAVMTMETARNDLARADALVAGGDYAQAIPLYRRSLMADDSATYRLQQAEAAYKNSLLLQAESAMAFGQYTMAEGVLTEGLALFAADEDLTRALSDVHRMEEDAAYAAQVEEACRLLQQEGPDAAFQYAASLRQQAPDAYEYDYIEQLVRLQYEEDICARALSLQAGGDPTGACALLEEGLTRLDSQRMRTLYGEIRAAMVFYLADMPVLRDETADPRTGAESTFVYNETTHSLFADLGSVTFFIHGGYESFTGTVAFPQGESSDLYRSSATLQVYGDGQLLAEFKNMDQDSTPLPFSIPVTGVDELTLCWTSEGANGWKDWGRFATVYDGKLVPPGGY